ncbi:hypothetical protein Dimus_004738 [Dionaea muscipula]
MASSMLNGERRLAATRRSGMTVLGKVAVPKPINLPSQKLENHGLDPNIEIVPKGTLSWGSKPSCSGSNAWGSKVSSPKADGSNASPSYLSSRPSSSGGTRPSTAGSEKGHDSTPNAWGSSLRPSSASGPSTPNHTSLASMRPRSAETRPGSSQLSRFAEPLAENLRPWDAAGSAEKSGVASSINDGFSLSSGDFPTLGSEKESNPKNNESLGHSTHGRPQLSSGKLSSVPERFGSSPGNDVSRNGEVKGSCTGTWRKDNTQHDGPWHAMERWHGDPPPYPTPISPHHYESWHNALGVNPPGGVWPRGPLGAPPYGAPIPPGGFHMEPFPYFRPQVSPPVLPNPHTVPLQGPGLHGPHLKNSDFFRPPMGDSYIHPAIPIRPGFYPGPVAFDGFYGPPMGFCNPNERDFPVMGMASAPPVYNRYPNPNATDASNSHAKSAETRAREKFEFGPHNSRGNHKALSQQDSGWVQNSEVGKWGNRITANASSGEQRDFPPSTLRKSPWEDDEKGDQSVYREKLSGEEASSQSFEYSAGQANALTRDMTPVIDNVVSPDHALIQKIEGLNAKVRTSDGRHDPGSGLHWEEPHSRVQVLNDVAGHHMNESGPGVVYLERHPTGILVPVSRDMNISMGVKSAETEVSSMTTISRSSAHHGVKNRGTHVKGRIIDQDADGLQKKNAASGTPDSVSGGSCGTTAEARVQEHSIVSQSIKPNIGGRDDTRFAGFDSCDNQRAMMREIAKQRVIQLQKEEEERTREQKAKALAKLEELNKRSAYQGKDGSSQMVDYADPVRQEVSEEQSGPVLHSDLSVPALSRGCNTVADTDEVASKALKSPVHSFIFGTVMQETVHEDPVSSLAQSMPFPGAQDTSNDGSAGHRTAVQACESSRRKRPSDKQKQNATFEENSAAKLILGTSTDFPKYSTTPSASEQVVVNGIASTSQLNAPVESQIIADSSTSLRKRNIRSSKYKHKSEESSSAVSPSAHPETDAHEDVKLECCETKLDLPPIQSYDPGDATSSTDKNSSLPQDGHGTVNHSWKQQHSRRTQRNAQISRTEKSRGNDSAVWAPVRSQSKVELIDDSSQKPTEVAIPLTKGDHVVKSSSKSKRAEMERYVPKPVAKELAQQGSIQQYVSPSTDLVNEDSMNRKASASFHTVEGSGSPGSNAESRNMNSYKTRQTRVQGSWRQRGNTESAPVQVSQDESFPTTNVSKNNMTSIELEQKLKPDKRQLSMPEDIVVKEQPPKIDEQDDLDGWIIYEEPITSSQVKDPGVKGHGTFGRGKRSSHRGYKGARSLEGADDSDFPLADTQQTERPGSSKQNRVVGDRGMPHWQPKSQPYVANTHRGNRSRGGASVSMDAVMTSKRETSHDRDIYSPLQQDLDDDMPATQCEQREETRGQRKSGPNRDHPHPHSHGDGAAGKFGPAAAAGSMDGHNQQYSSGIRKNGNYSNPLNRVHESHGERSSSMQDGKQHFVPGNQNRQRQNPHYEYQPTGPYGIDESSNFEAQMDNVHTGARSQERQRGYSRRGGNFYGRQRGNVLQVDGS